MSCDLFSLICYSEYVSWCHTFYINIEESVELSFVKYTKHRSVSLLTPELLHSELPLTGPILSSCSAICIFSFLGLELNYIWKYFFCFILSIGFMCLEWGWEDWVRVLLLWLRFPPLTSQMYKCYTCSVNIKLIKAAHGATYLFIFDSCWDSKGSTSEGSWPLLGNDSIQLHLTHSTALSCWALRFFKEHCHELRWKMKTKTREEICLTLLRKENVS